MKNEDDGNDYESDDSLNNDSLVEITDLNHMADMMRKQSICEFNKRYKRNGLALGNKNSTYSAISRISKKKLESIIKLDEVMEVLKEILPYDKEEETYSCNIELFWDCVDKITNKIFYHVANTLTDAGIYEMAFDGETNDFVWRPAPKYREYLEGHPKEDEDPDNS